LELNVGGVLMGWFVTLWVQSHELYLKGQMLTGNPRGYVVSSFLNEKKYQVD
jgi:hypothetical protein